MEVNGKYSEVRNVLSMFILGISNLYIHLMADLLSVSPGCDATLTPSCVWLFLPSGKTHEAQLLDQN